MGATGDILLYAKEDHISGAVTTLRTYGQQGVTPYHKKEDDMIRLGDLGWQLAWFDQLVRVVLGIGLVLGAGLGGWPNWATILAASIAGILIFEAAIQYCPLARLWPWNR
jgi:hypothetical protein